MAALPAAERREYVASLVSGYVAFCIDHGHRHRQYPNRRAMNAYAAHLGYSGKTPMSRKHRRRVWDALCGPIRRAAGVPAQAGPPLGRPDRYGVRHYRPLESCRRGGLKSVQVRRSRVRTRDEGIGGKRGIWTAARCAAFWSVSVRTVFRIWARPEPAGAADAADVGYDTNKPASQFIRWRLVGLYIARLVRLGPCSPSTAATCISVYGRPFRRAGRASMRSLWQAIRADSRAKARELIAELGADGAASYVARLLGWPKPRYHPPSIPRRESGGSLCPVGVRHNRSICTRSGYPPGGSGRLCFGCESAALERAGAPWQTIKGLQSLLTMGKPLPAGWCQSCAAQADYHFERDCPARVDGSGSEC